MELWEQIVLGAFVVAALFFFGPAAGRAISNSPKGSSSDWKGALIPIALVVGFVILLIASV